MSSSNNRFGRRTARPNDDARAEPVLSFNPKRPAARDMQRGAEPSVDRTPPSAPRVDRADAEEFGAPFGRGAQNQPIPSFMRGSEPGPRVDREDAQEFGMSHDSDDAPRIERGEKAMETRVPASERPLYQHLFDEDQKRGAGYGWAAALGSAVIIIVGAAYVWHDFMSRPTPGNLLAPPGIASRSPGYTTPAQPTSNADSAQDTASSQGSGVTPPASTMPATRDVATQAEPKVVPYEPPPPPRKTISEAAANPGNLGPPVIPTPAPDNAPPVAKQAVVVPAPIPAPPPKRERPRKEAALTLPKPAPAPVQQDEAPQDIAPPVQPAAAPAVSAPPRLRPPAQATGQPQQLNRDAPASYPQPQQLAPSYPQPQPQVPPPQQTNYAPPANFAPTNLAPSNATPGLAAPPASGTDTVTVDGVTYVNGQEPRALGTLGASQAPSDGSLPPGVSALPTQSVPSYSTRSYAPADRDGGAPLPNDVIILPNGQLAVPNGR